MASVLYFAPATPANAGTPAEFFNEYDWAPTAPTPGPTNFEIVFAGNVACQIPPQNQNDSGTDPFPNPNPITTIFDPLSNTTTVTFSGSALIPGQRYHFGLNQGFAPTPPLQVISKSWTYDTAPPSPLPIVNITPPAPLSPNGPFNYAIVYLEAAFAPGGQTYGSWYEVPYTPTAKSGAQPAITFTNYGTQPLYVSNTGIQVGLPVPAIRACKKRAACAINANLLDALNFAETPPPGQLGSKFVPIAVPPPPQLTPTPVVAPVTACAVAVTGKKQVRQH